MSGPPAGPAQLAWMEAGLQNLADVALPEGPKLLIIQLLHGYVRGEAQLSTDLSSPDPDFATAGSYGRIVRAVITPETHPALTRLVQSGVFDDATDYEEDVDFTFGLDRVLDGIAQMVDQQR
jgi:hypothetical protein